MRLTAIQFGRVTRYDINELKVGIAHQSCEAIVRRDARDEALRDVTRTYHVSHSSISCL
jgi:hypothetical protein